MPTESPTLPKVMSELLEIAYPYEPPLSKKGEPLEMGNEPWIAPGVRGYALEYLGAVHIPLIIAEPEGDGNVGRFLDALSFRCVVPTVTSDRLRGMLDRRGWVKMPILNEELWYRPMVGADLKAAGL